MRSIISFFYRQHLFGNLLTVLIIGFGIVSVLTIRKDVFPKVDFDVTLITAVFPGASPEQVEKLIVTPIEQAVREVDGIKKVQSEAVEGRAIITLTLDPDARKPDKTNTDIQRAVDRVENYPEEAIKPVVFPLETGSNPLIEIAVTSPDATELELRNAAKLIADELAYIPGVAKVTKEGWRKREYQVEVDQIQAKKNYVGLSQVIDAIRLRNVQLPAGDLTLPSGRENSIKTDGEIKSALAVGETVIRANVEGLAIRVLDVASLKDALEKPTLLYRTNQKRSFKLTVVKKEKADALRTVEAVRASLAGIRAKVPSSIEVSTTNDYTFYLKNRLSTLSGNMVMGIILVCFVLALFLPFRVALVVALGIPFSMFLAVMTIQYFGYSLNLISLIGLIIVSGMLVDDTIVVTENIYRRLEKGEPRDEAIIEGASEMVPAVTASVLTTVAAFGPMLFMSGIFGKFVFEIPLLVILPLLYSLIEAFLIAPGHILTLVGNSVAKKQKDSPEKAAQHWYARLLPRFRSFVAHTIQRRYLVVSLFLGLIVGSGILASQMRFVLFPPDGIYTFFVRIDGEPGATLEEMVEILEKVEPYIAELSADELKDFTTMIGMQRNAPNDPLTKRASHYAQIVVNLTPEGTRDRSVNQIVDELRERVPLPTGAQKMIFSIAQGGPPQGPPISINIYGEDFAGMRSVAADLKARLSAIEGVRDIQDSEVIGKQEYKVIPDVGEVARANLSVQEVATNLRAAFAGVVASSVRTLDEEIDIRVQLKSPGLEANRQLETLTIPNRMGDLVPLKQLARFETDDSRLIIQHEKYKRILAVTATVNLEQTTAIKATSELQNSLKQKPIDPRYELSFGGENEDTAESLNSLLRAFVIAAVLIFMILVLTFESFLQPLLVLLALPLGFLGVILALFIHNKPLSFMALLGVIALAGVIVNNSIVFIDFFNSRRKEVSDLKEAIVDSATVRLRPIAMTSLTTILGLMPTAYGLSGSDGFVATLALALGWGLMLGSVLTLIFMPAIMYIAADFEGRALKKLRSLARLG